MLLRLIEQKARAFVPGKYLKLNQMEQRAFKNVNNSLIMNIYSYLETSGGQSSNIYLNVVHFFNTCVY